MGTDNEQEYEIDLKEICIAILDRIWIVISVGIACALLAGIITKVFITPMYTSTTKLYVINKQNSENSVTYTDLQTGNLLTNDYIIQVKGTKVLSQVISELNLTDTEDELASRITVSNPENSRFIVISVSDKDPVVAQQIASCVAKVSSEVVKEVMDLEKVNVAEEANLPLEKSSPNLKKNVLLGGVAGVFVSLLLIVVFYLLNDHIRTPEDVKRYLGLNTLGQIPVLEDGGNAKKKQRHRKPDIDDEDDDEDENENEPVAVVPAVGNTDKIPVFVPGLSVDTAESTGETAETVSSADHEEEIGETSEDMAPEAVRYAAVISEEIAKPETEISEEAVETETAISESVAKSEKKSAGSKKKSKNKADEEEKIKKSDKADKTKKADKADKEKKADKPDKEDKPVKDKKSKKKKSGKKAHDKKDHDKKETEYAEGGEDNE